MFAFWLIVLLGCTVSRSIFVELSLLTLDVLLLIPLVAGVLVVLDLFARLFSVESVLGTLLFVEIGMFVVVFDDYVLVLLSTTCAGFYLKIDLTRTFPTPNCKSLLEPTRANSSSAELSLCTIFLEANSILALLFDLNAVQRSVPRFVKLR